MTKPLIFHSGKQKQKNHSEKVVSDKNFQTVTPADVELVPNPKGGV